MLAKIKQQNVGVDEPGMSGARHCMAWRVRYGPTGACSAHKGVQMLAGLPCALPSLSDGRSVQTGLAASEAAEGCTPSALVLSSCSTTQALHSQKPPIACAEPAFVCSHTWGE